MDRQLKNQVRKKWRNVEAIVFPFREILLIIIYDRAINQHSPILLCIFQFVST